MKCAMLSCSAHSADNLTFWKIQGGQNALHAKLEWKLTNVVNVCSLIRIP